MMKKSMDDPIKHRWREREYRFIKKHAGQLGNPKEWRIAFLPGGDAGLVPTELEMFESLGAQRTNLVGIEKDKDIYRKLKSRKLGINFEFVDTEEFFKNTSQKFDIISLDFSGQFSGRVENTLKYISGKQLLNNRAILTTNLYGRMEQSDVLSQYTSGLFSLNSDEILDNERLRKDMMRDWKDKVFRDMFGNHESSPFYHLLKNIYYAESETESKNENAEDAKDLFKRLGFNNIKKLRSLGITSETMSILLTGKEIFEINPIYLRNPNFEELEKLLIDARFRLTELGAKKSNFNPGGGIEIVDKLSIHTGALGSICHQIDLLCYLVDKGYLPDMMHLAHFYHSYPYFVENLESYWYRSENGSPMYSDFFYVNQFREIFEKHKEFVEKIYRDLEPGPLTKEFMDKCKGKQLEKLDGLSYSKFLKHVNSHPYVNERDLSKIKCAAEKINERIPERIFLGSSAERQELDGRTYYKLRTESAGKGQDRKELWGAMKTKYKTSNGQLRAFERHFNMETYGPTKIEKPAERETSKARTYALTEMFNSNHPYSFLERLPEETKTRLGYFLGEDLPLKINLNAAEKDELAKNIAGSKWYKVAEKKGATGQQIITFFDDIMLYCVWNEKVPDKDKINELLYNSLNGGHILPERLPKSYVAEVKKGGEDMSPRGSPRISKDAAVVLLKLGHDPLELSNIYSGHTPQQLRALKACNTMRKYDDLELNGELASELFGVCGLSTTDVRKAFPYLSTKKIGAYKAWDTMRSGK